MLSRDRAISLLSCESDRNTNDFFFLFFIEVGLNAIDCYYEFESFTLAGKITPIGTFNTYGTT